MLARFLALTFHSSRSIYVSYTRNSSMAMCSLRLLISSLTITGSFSNSVGILESLLCCYTRIEIELGLLAAFRCELGYCCRLELYFLGFADCSVYAVGIVFRVRTF